MEFKKKTIIWEDNNEPPKDYIWAKKDGKFYEYSYATRSWVESKSISGGNSGGSGGSGGDGGDSTPTEFYIKFKAENFGVRDDTNVPDTVDRDKGYRLDEILDMSDNTVENFISGVENNIENYSADSYYAGSYFGRWYPVTEYGDFNDPDSRIFNYFSIESGEYSEYSDGTCCPVISMAFIKENGIQAIQSTLLFINGTNLTGKSWTPPRMAFEKNKDDGLWYIVYAY